MSKAESFLSGQYLILKSNAFTRIYQLKAGAIEPAATCFDEREWQNTVPEISGDSSPAGWKLDTFPMENGLKAVLSYSGKEKYQFQLYDDISGMTFIHLDREQERENEPEKRSASGIEDRSERDPDRRLSSVTECCILRENHVKILNICLADRSDVCDHLCRMEEYHVSCNEPLHLSGCLMAAEDPVSGTGLLWLKHAPLPGSRPEEIEWDFEASLQKEPNRNICCIRLRDHGYPAAVLAYENGSDGITRALQRYMRKRIPYRADLDGRIISNTWGDRNRDMALNESFMLREIDHAAELGVEVCQIDDGWQEGVSANSGLAKKNGGGLWNSGFHDEKNFWKVNSHRFPNGFGTVCDRCRSRNVGLGLWFSPDGAEDLSHWAEDSEQLVRFHRENQVCWFKIDGVQISSRTGMKNLQNFFRRTEKETNGGIVFDLDVTAGRRPGYFGMEQPGAIFVENRYTDTGSWLPSSTFRNLWSLARFLPPSRLRMEILNPDRNQACYRNDRLAPSQYGMDWIFCSVMPASPLFWCELQHLSEERKNELRPMIALWKKYRGELHGGIVYPVGEMPNGFNWSGYYICGKIWRHLIVLRDHARTDSCTIPLPEPCNGSWEKIAGNGILSQEGPENVSVHLSETCSFAWFRSDEKTGIE